MLYRKELSFSINLGCIFKPFFYFCLMFLKEDVNVGGAKGDTSWMMTNCNLSIFFCFVGTRGTDNNLLLIRCIIHIKRT